jgi:hypothetical protein
VTGEAALVSSAAAFACNGSEGSAAGVCCNHASVRKKACLFLSIFLLTLMLRMHLVSEKKQKRFMPGDILPDKAQ